MAWLRSNTPTTHPNTAIQDLNRTPALRRAPTVFSDLPYEVKEMIWKQALPRVITLRQKKLNKSSLADARNSNNEDVYMEDHLVGLLWDCPPSNIRYVCREFSRFVSESYHKVISPHESIPPSWFCPELDTLYLRYDKFFAGYADRSLSSVTHELGNSAFSMLDMDNLSKVKNIALLLPERRHGDMPLENSIATLARTLGGLEKLYLVVRNYEMEGQDTTDFFIMDPIDVPETIRSYIFFYPTLGSEILEEISLDCTSAEVNIGELRSLLADDINRGRTPWRIPQIETKVVVDRGYTEKLAKAKLAAQKRVYDARKEYQARKAAREKKREEEIAQGWKIPSDLFDTGDSAEEDY